MRVDIEKIREMEAEIKRINNADLADVELYENGIKVQIDHAVIEEYKYIGLNNWHFFSTEFYNNE